MKNSSATPCAHRVVAVWLKWRMYREKWSSIAEPSRGPPPKKATLSALVLGWEGKRGVVELVAMIATYQPFEIVESSVINSRIRPPTHLSRACMLRNTPSSAASFAAMRPKSGVTALSAPRPSSM